MGYFSRYPTIGGIDQDAAQNGDAKLLGLPELSDFEKAKLAEVVPLLRDSISKSAEFVVGYSSAS